MLSSASSSSSLSSASARFEDARTSSPDFEPSLETLVPLLVAAKRSLSSIHHVCRANEIVTAARVALEESVIVSSRTGFLRRGLDEQIRVLYKLRAQVEGIAHRGRSEFADAIEQLDAADDRLHQVVTLLHQTKLDPAFWRDNSESSPSLRDFVDDRGPADNQSKIKKAIDNVNTSQSELGRSNREFDDDLNGIHRAFRKYRMSVKGQKNPASSISPSSISSSSGSRLIIPTPAIIPDLLHSLELNAQELADLLQSLVHHFDLCVTAVKHTEGGGVVARNITDDLHANGADAQADGNDEPDNKTNIPNYHEGSHDNNDDNFTAQLEPLTDSEYREMVSVIRKDAVEAEDVVLEMQDRVAEMESSFDKILEQRDSLIVACMSTTDVFRRLSKFTSTRLPAYTAQANNFLQAWKTEHEVMKEGIANLGELRIMYVAFLKAYDGLILEVARRKSARTAVEEVLSDARAKLDKLYDKDLKARKDFVANQGQFLPTDVWSGAEKAPMRIEFQRVYDDTSVRKSSETEHPQPDSQLKIGGHPGAEEGGTVGSRNRLIMNEVGESIPDLPAAVIEAAYGRLHNRPRGTRQYS